MNFRRNVSFDSRIRKAEATVLFGDITAAGMSKTLDLAAFLLPVDAYLLGTELNVLVAYTDGAAGTVKLDIGISGSGTIYLVGAANNLGAATGRIAGGVPGTTMPAFQGGVQTRLTFTGSVNLNTLTGGSVLIRMHYFRTDRIIPEERG